MRKTDIDSPLPSLGPEAPHLLNLAVKICASQCAVCTLALLPARRTAEFNYELLDEFIPKQVREYFARKTRSVEVLNQPSNRKPRFHHLIESPLTSMKLVTPPPHVLGPKCERLQRPRNSQGFRNPDRKEPGKPEQ